MSALLSGTAAKLALDFLRSGRLVDEAGLKTLQKAYKATNRGEAMPEEAVSEFRKILNALKTRDVAEQIHKSRTLRRVPLEARPPSELLPAPQPVAKYIEESGGIDNVVMDLLQEAEYANTNAARSKGLMLSRLTTPDERLIPENRPVYASSAGFPEALDARSMQASRRSATLSRANAQRLEALYRLFGDLTEI